MKKNQHLLKIINLLIKALEDDSLMYTDHYNTNQHPEFKENKYQIASYAKNWRYTGGGNVNIFKSKFKSKLNRFFSLSDPGDENKEKKQKLIQDSIIQISSSKIEGEILKEGKNIFLK